MTPKQQRLYIYKKLQYHIEHKEKMPLEEFLEASRQIKDNVMNGTYKENISEYKLNKMIEEYNSLNL
jgi:hypothetical protein